MALDIIATKTSTTGPVLNVTPAVASPINVSVGEVRLISVSVGVNQPMVLQVGEPRIINVKVDGFSYTSSALQSLAKSFSSLVVKWSVANPTVPVGGGGTVRDYTDDGVTFYYRFIPSPYDPTLDAFYSSYAGGVLSGLITRRATAV